MITGPVSRLLMTQSQTHESPWVSVYLHLQALPGQARSWYGKEQWFSLEEFSGMLQSTDYNPLINCESWQVSSLLKPQTFHCLYPFEAQSATDIRSCRVWQHLLKHGI